MRIPHVHLRRTSGLVAAALVGAAFVAPVVNTVASATQGPTGYVEICKTFTAPPIAMNTTAPFTFSISHVSGTFTVNAGSCSAPIAVPAGVQTISETQAPWYKVSSITQLPGQSYLLSTNLSAGTATVNVTAGGNVAEVTFTNDPVTGYLEICKSAASGSGLVGSYSFNVTGADGFASSATVPVGACTTPMQVPAGPVTVGESGTNLYVTGITASLNGVGNMLLGSPNLTNGTATVNVLASSDPSNQTDVTYTNNVVALKVCKVFDSKYGAEPGGSSTAFPFSFSASGPVGPNSAPGPLSLLAGTWQSPVCSNPVSYRPGTTVSITEGIVPGTKAESIVATGAQSVVPGSVSLTNRTISVVVGTPVTASGLPTNEAIVTYTDMAADPGTLKICKLAGSPAPNGSSFSFTVSGVPGTVTVPLGSCEIVGGSQSPWLFPFNSRVVVTELGSTSNATSAISVVPTYVTQVVGSTPTLTSEPVLVGSPSLGGAGTASSVTVMTGERTLTEVSFTDVDPPVPAGPPVTVTNPGGSDQGTTSAASQSVATTVASNVAAAVSAASSSPAASSSSSSSSPAASSSSSSVQAPANVKSASQALVLRDQKQLAKVNAAIRTYERLAARTKGAAHTAAMTHLRSLQYQAMRLQAALSVSESSSAAVNRAIRQAELARDQHMLAQVNVAIRNAQRLVSTSHGAAHVAAVHHLSSLQIQARQLQQAIHRLG